ncbi:MAG: DUF5329 family protein [Lysobacterales bacterium]
MKIKALLLVALLPLSAACQTASGEIDQLFKALEVPVASSTRNGSWYDAQKASEHLHRKYDYLLKKGLVTSTESFIDLGASRSSMSGKPYPVRCGKSPPVESRSWFMARLSQIRRGLGTDDSLEPGPIPARRRRANPRSAGRVSPPNPDPAGPGRSTRRSGGCGRSFRRCAPHATRGC